MHFYVDESGHTGANLFDVAQPTLYYGVLSSPVNVDVLSADRMAQLRRKLGVERLHAAELGNSGLVAIAPKLAALQKTLELRFDLYRVAKPDHAVICFFDQVFDQGMNPAMTWTGYWTPMRYVLLLKISHLFDEDLARRAWEARLELNDQRSELLLSEICSQLVARLDRLPDARSRQLIGDTLRWAADHPSELCFNTKTKEDRLSIMPNIIGFQSVVLGIASRLKKKQSTAARLVVDRQSQFNQGQKTLHDLYVRASTIKFANGPGLPELSFKGVPKVPIEFVAGKDSCGLELVDLYLWAFKRMFERKTLAPELAQAFVRPQIRRGQTDEISLRAIEQRWTQWFEELPEPSPEAAAKGRELLAMFEKKRLDGMAGIKTD